MKEVLINRLMFPHQKIKEPYKAISEKVVLYSFILNMFMGAILLFVFFSKREILEFYPYYFHNYIAYADVMFGVCILLAILVNIYVLLELLFAGRLSLEYIPEQMKAGKITIASLIFQTPKFLLFFLITSFNLMVDALFMWGPIFVSGMTVFLLGLTLQGINSLEYGLLGMLLTNVFSLFAFSFVFARISLVTHLILRPFVDIDKTALNSIKTGEGHDNQ